MPRWMDTIVTCERVGEIRLTIVRWLQHQALPVVRQNASWGCGCWGSRHPNLLRVLQGSSIERSERFSMSPLWVRFLGTLTCTDHFPLPAAGGSHGSLHYGSISPGTPFAHNGSSPGNAQVRSIRAAVTPRGRIGESPHGWRIQGAEELAWVRPYAGRFPFP